jgi:hypothetical protein
MVDTSATANVNVGQIMQSPWSRTANGSYIGDSPSTVSRDKQDALI